MASLFMYRRRSYDYTGNNRNYNYTCVNPLSFKKIAKLF